MPEPTPKQTLYIVLGSDDGIRFTTITASEQSVCFDTTDHEGGNEDGFELTWAELFALGKEYMAT